MPMLVSCNIQICFVFSKDAPMWVLTDNRYTDILGGPPIPIPITDYQYLSKQIDIFGIFVGYPEKCRKLNMKKVSNI